MKTKKIIALITSFMMLLGVSSWAYADVNEDEYSDETSVEVLMEESSYTDESEELANTEETEESSVDIPEETEISDLTDEDSQAEDDDETDEELVISDENEEDESEEIEDEEELEIEYDVEGFEMNGWWVPSIIYNDEEDTISFYLEDGTCFYTSPMAGLGHSNTWQGTGFWGYVEITYGGADNLSADEYNSYSSVLNSLS